MIPSTTGFLNRDFDINEQPSRTYRIDLENKAVRGMTDGREAIEQAVFRILNTERYKYIIYPWYYGVETLDLYGEPIDYVCSEVERRITEALLVDERITGVKDFSFDISKKGIVSTTFTVNTIYGEIKANKEVPV